MFRDRLLAASRRFNLTAIRDAEGIERRHLIESLAFGDVLAKQGLLSPGQRLLDLGSGAGLPGLPIKIAWPLVELVLLDANARRCQFLRDVAAELALADVEVLEGRAESLGHEARLRGGFDLVVSRAMAPLPVLIEYALPFLKIGGILAASKGSSALAEITASTAALHELGGVIEAVAPFLPPNGQPQSIIIVRKQTETPPRYPRRTGIPAKRPL